MTLRSSSTRSAFRDPLLAESFQARTVEFQHRCQHEDFSEMSSAIVNNRGWHGMITPETYGSFETSCWLVTEDSVV